MENGNGNDSDATWIYKMVKILMHLDSYSENVYYKPKYDAMIYTFDKYWRRVPVSLALASMMDPRYKIFVLDLDKSPEKTKSRKMLKVHKIKLTKMYKEYCQKMTVTAHGLDEGSSSLVETKSDLQKYLDEPIYKVKKGEIFDVLEWWKAEERSYPILSTMARELLTIPVSGIASNACGNFRVMNQFSLKKDMVKALLHLRDSFMHQDAQVKDSNHIEEMMEGLAL